MRNTRRFLAMILAVVMALACVSVASADAQPDSWIADRTIVVQRMWMTSAITCPMI